jgi:hypothetical protein
MTETPQNPPPGYYPDGNGRQRYWDGTAWTDQYAPETNPQAPTSAPTASGPVGNVQTATNPRAEAKAAKAYAKASRPWYQKKRWIALIIIGILIVIAIATSGGGSGDDSSSPTSGKDTTSSKSDGNSASKSKDTPSAYGSRKFPMQNGDWRLDSIKVKDDGFGGWAATGRITYTGDDSDGGNNLFTVTLFKGKEVVGTLTGGGNTVKPGTTVTVQFLETGSSKYVKGPYKYDFQNDL